MRCLSRNAGFSLGGGGGDGGFCIQIYRLGQKGDRVLELMNLRPVYISLQLRRNFSLSWNWQKSAVVPLLPQTMHTKFIFAFTKTITILKLIYRKIIDFRFRTVLKYVVHCDVILRCKQRWYEHCIILKRQVQVVLVILRLTTTVRRYLGSHAGCDIHEHGARGRLFPADNWGAGGIYFYSLEHFAHVV